MKTTIRAKRFRNITSAFRLLEQEVEDPQSKNLSCADPYVALFPALVFVFAREWSDRVTGSTVHEINVPPVCILKTCAIRADGDSQLGPEFFQFRFQ